MTLTLRRIFPKRLKHHRTARNLSQAALATKAGLAPTHLSHFEAGRRIPTLENFVHLVNALGVSADELLFGNNDD
jgi:transcriptional regulator with XRE-family HTH domain